MLFGQDYMMYSQIVCGLALDAIHTLYEYFATKVKNSD
jgi:hypothetical protein